MRKILFLILFLFSMSLISAQEKLSKEEKERREKNVQAGNPFAKFGSKAPVATLSKGKYLEVHDLDSIVTIGTIRWHVENQQIVGRMIRDTENPDAQPIGDATGRWLSPDPLSEEFPGWSPYNYVFNNPVKFTDPNGRAPIDITLWGWDSYSQEYRKTVVVKSNIYNVDYYSRNIAAPTAIASRANWEPTTIYGFDLWATLSGKPDAVRFNMTAELHAGGVNVGGTLGVVAPLQGKDKGGLFFYGPSGENGFDIGFEKASYSIEIGTCLGFSLIYKDDNNFRKFNRFTFEGLEESIGANYGIFSASIFKSSDDSYKGFTVGIGLSKGVSRDPNDKRGNKNASTSGAKLIEKLTIEPGPKKD